MPEVVPSATMGGVLNGTFFKNSLIFVAILGVGFTLMVVIEYFRAEQVTEDTVEIYTGCVTVEGEPC